MLVHLILQSGNEWYVQLQNVRVDLETVKQGQDKSLNGQRKIKVGQTNCLETKFYLLQEFSCTS